MGRAIVRPRDLVRRHGGKLATLLVLGGLVAPGPARAQGEPWHRFNLELGGLLVGSDSAITLGPASLGLNLDAERAFDLNTALGSGYVSVDYRLGREPRHRLAASYRLFLRKGTRTLDEEIQLGDQTFPVNASVDATYNVHAAALTYQYSVVHDDRMDLGVGLSVYAVPLLFELVTVAGEGEGGSVREDIVAPVPTVSLRGHFAISPSWFLLVDLDWIALNLADVEGRMLSTRLTLEWRFSDPVGVGLGFNSFDLDIEAEQGSDVPGLDFTGRYRTNFAGLLGYFALRL